MAETDWGHAMHLAAEVHMGQVWAAFEARQAGEPGVEDPAHDPFDGCDTCVVREVLAGAWPVIQDYVQHMSGTALVPIVGQPGGLS